MVRIKAKVITIIMIILIMIIVTHAQLSPTLPRPHLPPAGQQHLLEGVSYYFSE